MLQTNYYLYCLKLNFKLTKNKYIIIVNICNENNKYFKYYFVADFLLHTYTT